MINQFQKRGHNGSLIKQKIDKDNLQEREQLLKKKKERETLPHQSLYHSNIIEHSLKKRNCYETWASSAYKPKSR